jgi:hypothetical protein
MQHPQMIHAGRLASIAAILSVLACGGRQATPTPNVKPPVATPAPPSTALEASSPDGGAPEGDAYGLFRPWPPTIISTPSIAPPVLIAPFVRAGCVAQDHDTVFDCRKVRGAPAAACRTGVYREDALGGLAPNIAILTCYANPTPDSGLYNGGGMIPSERMFLVAEARGVVPVRTRADFVRRFGPVDTPAKALGFAAAFTDGRPVFDPPLPPQEYTLYASRIEGTKVVATANGWQVNLFSWFGSGCGTHPTTTLEVQVDRDGAVSVRRFAALYADPSRRSCVD